MRPRWIDKGEHARLLAMIVAGIEANPGVDLTTSSVVSRAEDLLDEIVRVVDAEVESVQS